MAFFIRLHASYTSRGLYLLLAALSLDWISACSINGVRLWQPLSSGPDDGLFRFIRRGKAGFIDRSGKVVIPATLAMPTGFSEGLLIDRSNHESIVLDTKGHIVLGKKIRTLTNVGDFHEGLAAATENRLVGFINRQGNFAVKPQFPLRESSVGWFSEGLASVDFGGLVGYIDRTGRYAIPRQFAAGSDFKGGYAAVVDSGPCSYKDWSHLDVCSFVGFSVAPMHRTANNGSSSELKTCRWKFIDKRAHQAFDGEFDAVLDFSEGLAAVKVKDKWGYIDGFGKFIIPPKFYLAASFSEGLAWVRLSEKECGYIDRSGVIRIQTCDWPPFGPERFSEGMVPVRLNGGMWTFMGKDGRQSISKGFLAVSGFSHGLAHVQTGGELGGSGSFAFIDHLGKTVFSYVSDIRQ